MKRILLGIVFVCSNFLIYSQILVVKVDSQGIVQAISDEDIEQYNQQIVEILLKYTWPTCIAHDLTDEEKSQLLTSDISGAELKFVRKKIKEVSEKLDVVFVPTTLYELFAIKVIKKLDLSTFSQHPSLFDIFNENENFILKRIKQDIILKSPVEHVKQEIKNEYNRFNNKISNNLFYNTSVLVFHKMFIEYLASFFELVNILRLHQVLYNNRYEIMTKLLESEEISRSWLGIDTHDRLGILKKGINLDYKVFDKNQALLFRGSNFLNVPALHGSKKILATTVHGVVSYYNDQENLLQKARSIPSYSLSFGNSLFAGIYNDQGACAYQYLKKIQDFGYAICIDKFAYVDNYISNLFFIAPLATEVGLLGSGEWFHSRSKPVTLVKTDKMIHVYGVAGPAILDPYGVFLIVRNPYKQAQLFSDYLAKNGVIFHKGNYRDLTNEEKNGLIELMKSQKEIGEEYKVAAWFKNLEHKLKKDILKKKEVSINHQDKNFSDGKQPDLLATPKSIDSSPQSRDLLSEQNEKVVRDQVQPTWYEWLSSWLK